MINLLPPQQRGELLLRKKFKLVLIFGILILSFLISLSLVLLLIKISLSKDLEIEKIYFQEKEKKVALKEPLKEKIKEVNLKLSQLKSFYQNQRNPTEILEKIFQILPPGITLESFNFSISKENIPQISLSGFSLKREDLISFKENLESKENFFEIYFPPENWIGSTNINFNLTFKVK